MRKLISTLFLFCMMAFAAQAQIVINEISYNTPSVDVEFIELYNNSSNTVDLSGWSFSEGITYTFPSGISMPANAYLLVCEDSLRMVNYFGVNAYQWSSGNLSNSGEDIILVDDMGAGIDTVDYEDNSLGWPEICDGQGPSLVLCDVNSNNNDPANWSFSTTSSGTRHGTDSSMLFCSPGAANAACPTSPFIILNGTYDEVSEGSGSYDLSFFMANTGPSDTSSVEVTVTMASTASGSTDYTFTTTTVGIGPDGFAGRSFASITIPLIDDMIPEADETIVFSLSNPSLGATIANAGDYVLKIIDDDPVDSIATVTTNDANGVADSLNAQVALRGVVYGVDMQGGNSVQFTLIDSTGGIAVFSGNSFGYTVNEGDGLFMTGTISQFNGLTQLNPDTIFVESTGNALVSPAVVTALDESTESELVRINGVSLVTPSQWPAAGSNANVDITDGTNTYTLRIDRDTDVDGTPAPAGTFDVIGLGGQFDNSSPFDAGYQILPRYQADIITGNTGSGLPLYPIATVTTNDANGVADSSGVQCELRGVVYGVDMQGSASVSFTVIDPTGGIGVFSSNDYGYTVTEGDSVHIPGTIGQFNGLTQINPDTIILVATGSALINPAVVTALDESTESELVRINGVSLVDPTQWPASGSSANVDLTDGTNTYLMRIDSDTDVDGMPAPTGNFDVVGLGGQFDNSSPFDGGYQILPRYMPDIILPPAPLPRYNIGLITTDNDNNGVADSLNVRCEIQGIVHGVDLQGGGSVQFTVIDSTGGIGVFSSNDYGYTVLEGDEVLIPGEVSEFRGLSQMTPDTIIVLSTGNTLTTPLVVTTLDESTESEMITLECVALLDTADWPTPGAGGSGATIDITNGTDTLTLRIDRDVDLFETPVPSSKWLNITGIGGQFSFNPSDLDGYQLLPRYQADVVALPDPTVSFASASGTVLETDPSITVVVDQADGNPDTTEVTIELDAVNSTATEGDDFSFSTTTLKIAGCGTGSASFDLTILDDMDAENAVETVVLVITSVSNNGSASVDTTTINIIDDEAMSISDLLPKNAVSMFPNPASSTLNLQADFRMERVSITNMMGQQVATFGQVQKEISMDVSRLTAGTYFVRIQSEQGVWVSKWMKK